VSGPKPTPYEQTSLSRFSLKQRLEIRIADIAFYTAIKLIGRTIRYQTEDWQHFEAIQAAKKLPIYAFWHDRIFAGTYYFRDQGNVAMTSESKDGEYIARFIRRLGYGAIRGSSSRGGSRALVEMIRAMRGGMPMAFTADGPRGPRYVAKPGAVLLAKRTGEAILPVGIECERYWTMKSWDRMQIPKPFTRAAIILGHPIYVSKDDDVDEKLAELQASLDSLVTRGEDWRNHLSS
jgi:lysophospholipid acyltransferase (LPLAT)-like uncharacterized protein